MQNNDLDQTFVSQLRCPLSKSTVAQESDFLVAEKGGLKYPIRKGIPVMLVDQAELPEGVETFEQLLKMINA